MKRWAKTNFNTYTPKLRNKKVIFASKNRRETFLISSFTPSHFKNMWYYNF